MTDNAQILTTAQVQQLSVKLEALETETSHQLVILTIEDLNNEPIEDYAYKTFKVNTIGQKGKDNGMLLVIAKEDKKARIEVGYGLEHVVTDVMASRIIRNELTPEFKKKNHFAGVDAATNSLIKILNSVAVEKNQIYETPSSTPTPSPAIKTGISNSIPKDTFGTILGKHIFSILIMTFMILSFLFIKVSFNAWVMTLVGAFTNKVSFSKVFGYAYKTGQIFFFGFLIFTSMFFLLLALLLDIYPDYFFFLLENKKWIAIPVALFVIPVLFALMKVKYYNRKLNFSLSNNDTYFIRKEIDSKLDILGLVHSKSDSDSYQYSSSGRNYSNNSTNSGNSNNSSSGYSGKGGRSGGGGASGSW
ncbi:YgcG family protein [Cellulophaga sp. HaHa_2_1]|uniref:TPM domain-containing protein n=1 Tax=Cellulophaga sp. HaHa_2_1 TaxID=2749994 RepID=UPI001C4E63EB|nr:TPM domain-containing protein [Cellulophaga sp. HaHa_2_1]QXP52947.1 TPM domain-containing protein [Cellulophaga sp. HaHa_2_1]